MIIFTHYSKKYQSQVVKFIYNTMLEELVIDKSTLDKVTMDLNNIEKNYINKNGNLWLAIDEETNEIVGTIGVIEIEKGIGELKRFYVKKEYRNKKIGCKLYNIAEQYALEYCFTDMYLVSGKELVSAHKFYEQNGWKKVSNKKEKVNIFVRDNANLYKKQLILKYQIEDKINNWVLPRVS